MVVYAGRELVRQVKLLEHTTHPDLVSSSPKLLKLKSKINKLAMRLNAFNAFHDFVYINWNRVSVF